MKTADLLSNSLESAYFALILGCLTECGDLLSKLKYTKIERIETLINQNFFVPENNTNSNKCRSVSDLLPV